MTRLRQSPASVKVVDPRSGQPTTIELTEAMFASGRRLSLYDASWSSPIPAMLMAADEGQYEPLMGLVTQIAVAISQQIHFGMFMAVTCSEDVPLLTEADLADADRTFVGGGFLRSLQSTCARWPTGSLPAGYLEPVRSDVPVLLMAGELDPVTPPATAHTAAATLSRSLVVPFPATAHGTSNAAACEQQLVRDFIGDPDPAELDTTCTQSLRRPEFVLPQPH